MLSKACEYGVRATLFLAMHSGPGNKINAVEIARAINAPKFFLAKVLQVLSKKGLLSSSKGPSGGFYLNEENRKSSLLAIIEAIDGLETMNRCILGLSVCSEENPCPLHMQTYAYRQGLMYQLEHQRIGDVARRVQIEKLAI